MMHCLHTSEVHLKSGKTGPGQRHGFDYSVQRSSELVSASGGIQEASGSLKTADEHLVYHFLVVQ
jgi:hypothetical protein